MTTTDEILKETPMNQPSVKIKEDGTLEYAPNVLDGFYNPSEARRRAHGYLQMAIVRAPETHRDGCHWEPGPWEVVDGEVSRRWMEIPDPPRVFSKLKVVAALMKAGVWPQVKAYIEQNGLYDLYLAAQEFAEDNAWFVQGLAALKPVVGWTDAQVEALLSKCVKE